MQNTLLCTSQEQIVRFSCTHTIRATGKRCSWRRKETKLVFLVVAGMLVLRRNRLSYWTGRVVILIFPSWKSGTEQNAVGSCCHTFSAFIVESGCSHLSYCFKVSAGKRNHSEQCWDGIYGFHLAQAWIISQLYNVDKFFKNESQFVKPGSLGRNRLHCISSCFRSRLFSIVHKFPCLLK